MQLPPGLIAYLRVPFVMIVWVMDTYTNNRDRFKTFMADPRVRNIYMGILVVTAVAWGSILFTATEEDKSLLTDALKGAWSDSQKLSEERKVYQDSLEAEQ
jgi:hypothetical protein